MNTHEIIETIQNFNPGKYNFIGCFNNDHYSILEKIPSNNYFFVVNALKSNENGMGHWVGFFKGSGNILIYVDSMSMDPIYYDGLIGKIYKTFNFLNIVKIPYKLQAPNSLLCGGYVIYMFKHLCRGIPFKSILKKFTSNRLKNDAFIKNFIETEMSMKYLCTMTKCPGKIFNTICPKKCKCN